MITIELRVVPYVLSIFTRITISGNIDMPWIQQVIPSESFMSSLDQKSSKIDTFASRGKVISEKRGTTYGVLVGPYYEGVSFRGSFGPISAWGSIESTTILSYPRLSYPRLSYPRLSYPRLSYPRTPVYLWSGQFHNTTHFLRSILRPWSEWSLSPVLQTVQFYSL